MLDLKPENAHFCIARQQPGYQNSSHKRASGKKILTRQTGKNTNKKLNLSSILRVNISCITYFNTSMFFFLWTYHVKRIASILFFEPSLSKRYQNTSWNIHFRYFKRSVLALKGLISQNAQGCKVCILWSIDWHIPLTTQIRWKKWL